MRYQLRQRFWSHGVELLPDEDAILILASAIVIDMACHDGKR